MQRLATTQVCILASNLVQVTTTCILGCSRSNVLVNCVARGKGTTLLAVHMRLYTCRSIAKCIYTYMIGYLCVSPECLKLLIAWAQIWHHIYTHDSKWNPIDRVPHTPGSFTYQEASQFIQLGIVPISWKLLRIPHGQTVRNHISKCFNSGYLEVPGLHMLKGSLNICNFEAGSRWLLIKNFKPSQTLQVMITQLPTGREVSWEPDR